MEHAANREIVDGYLADCRRRYLRKKSITSYTGRLGVLVRDLGDQQLIALTRHDVDAWLDKHARCAQTRASYRSTLALLFDWMVIRDMVVRNPARETVRTKVPRGRPRPVVTSELARAMRTATPQMRVMLVLAAYAGLRCMEIAGLAAGDVDLEAKRIWVADGKGGKSRELPMHDEVLVALQAITLPRRGSIVGLDADQVSARIRYYLTRIEVAGGGHRLRHWFASSAAEVSDIQTVAELLGHADIRTTQIYAAWASKKGRAAVDAIPIAS